MALALLAGLGVVRVAGADPKEDAAKRALDMANMALGYKLADLGRQAGSPEVLVGAAKLLNGIQEIQVAEDVKPAVGTDKEKAKPGAPVDESKVKAGDLSKDVEGLLKEARDLAKDDKSVLALIDSVKVTKGKGSLGGPWTSPTKGLAAGESHTYNFNFRGGEEAYINVTASQPVHLEVYRPNGTLVKDFNGRVCDISWTPGDTKQFTVYVTNLTNKTATYAIYKN
jgi:hypothetical protein